MQALAAGGFEYLNRDGDVADPGETRPEIAYVGVLKKVGKDGVRARLLLRDREGNSLADFKELATYEEVDEGASIQDIVLDRENWRTGYILDINDNIWQTTDAGATKEGWTNLTGTLNFFTENISLLSIELIKVGGQTVLLATLRGARSAQ